MGIGQNIRNLRTDAGMSQEELAERLDPPYTRPAVTAWEAGRAKPRMDTVVQIAELFGVSVAALMEEAAGRVGELLGPSPRHSPEDVARHGDVPAGGEGRGTPPGVG